MTEEELKNIEGPYSWIAKDMEDMQYFAGGQIITDVKRLIAEVRRLKEVNQHLAGRLAIYDDLYAEPEE